MTTDRKPRNIFWPSVATVEEAAWATKQAFGAAVFCSGVTAVLAILAICGVEFVKRVFKLDGSALFDAGLFAVVAVFLWRQSRVAAWAGCLLYLGERIYMWGSNPASLRHPFLSIVIILAFIAGIRGTT